MKRRSYASEPQLDMTDMANMVGGLNLEGGLGLTGHVEVNELTSVQRLSRRILRRTAEISPFSVQSVQEIQLNPAAGCRREKEEPDPVCRWRETL